MDSDATSDDNTTRADQPGAIPGRSAEAPAPVSAVRQAARPNRGFLWHRALPTPESAELLERSRDQLAGTAEDRAETSSTDAAGPGVVPPRDEQQVAPSVAPLGDDFDLDAALEELTSRNAQATASRFEAWRRRSATGALLTGIALGLQQVFEPERKEPNIVLETSGQPPRDLPVEAELDQLLPRETVVKVRPWLLPSSTSPVAAAPRTPAAPAVEASWRLAVLAPVGALRLGGKS